MFEELSGDMALITEVPSSLVTEAPCSVRADGTFIDEHGDPMPSTAGGSSASSAVPSAHVYDRAAFQRSSAALLAKTHGKPSSQGPSPSSGPSDKRAKKN